MHERLQTLKFLADWRGEHVDEPYVEWNISKGLNLVRRLPAIEEVRFDRIREADPYKSMRPLQRMADYSSIIINDSLISGSCVSRMIRSARRLDRFVHNIDSSLAFDYLSHYLPWRIA